MSDTSFQRHLDGAERQCLESLDPFAHFVILESIETVNPLPFNISDKVTGEHVADHPAMTALRQSENKRQNYLKALKRIFRYFSSETLVLMLLSGRPFGPFVRTTSVLRHEKLNEVFKSLARKEVPKGYTIKIKGNPLSFEKWLSFRFTTDPNGLCNHELQSIVALIVEEAEMLSDRGAINAFKHCRPFAHAGSPKFILTNHDGTRTSANQTLNGINWIEWKETKNELRLSYLSEEIEDGHDQQRLFSVGLLLDSLKTIRLAELNGTVGNLEITLPVNLKSGLRVRRQRVSIKYSGSENMVSSQGAGK